ncbi:restriction endonuclease subunit S (plasmid) [Lactococcus garvieae]|uniref:restriction endonuclease subunit S n=1 Tax=Lactococcus garvieae TaxID=1363 RepID=UPI001A930593|nr:restriction endonuclease subunit S [Lactococcus garvieae]QSQ99382.1 restriction endonuclease subunit S [Lactococcus garvieae]
MAKIDDSVKKKVPELRFAGFADDWEERKLGEFSDVRDGTHASPKYVSQGHPMVTSKNLTHSGLDMADVSFLTDEDFNEINKRSKVSIGDILFGMIGTIGNPVIVDRDDFAIKNVALIKEKTSNPITNKWLLQYLKSPSFNRFIQKENAGGTQKFIALGLIRDMKLRVPEFDEQQKIGSFFKQLDDTISLHQRKLDLLKEQKKGYLQKMFPKNGAKVPELRFAGFADDWEERKLGEVIDIENGYAFKSEYFSDEEKRHIVLTPGSVKIGGGFQKDKGRYYDVSGVFPEKFIFKPGNIFITMTDLTPTAQSLGYPAIVPRDDNVYLHNQRLGKIINTTTNPEFLYTLLTTDTYHKEIVSSASGTTVKHSSVSKILDFKSAIPNIDEQKLIGSFFKELDNTIALHQRKLDLLKEQKKGFLQKMFV